MKLFDMPEWTLSPVRLVFPEKDQGFPRLFQPASPEAAFAPWYETCREEVKQAFRSCGAILFRGFDVDSEEEFQRVAGHLSGTLESRYGDLVKRSTAHFVYDATKYPANRAILFHNEGSHTPKLPTRQFFFCGRDGFVGGETPVVDCRRVYLALPRALRARLQEEGLLYQRNFIPGVDVSWQDFFRTKSRADVEKACRAGGIEWEWRADGGLRTRARVPAVLSHPTTGDLSFCNQILLHHVSCLDPETREALLMVFQSEDLPRNVYFGGGQPISDEDVFQILRTTAREAVRFTWKRGDVLMLDNLVTAHARSPFRGDRQILVAIGDVMQRR